MPDYRPDVTRCTTGLGVLLLVGGGAHAASVTVNFDQLPDGAPLSAPAAFAQTHPVREEFAGLGVRFSVPPGAAATVGGGGVLSGNFGIGGVSGPNFLAFNANPFARYQNGQNPLPPQVVQFDQPANHVRLKTGGFGGQAALTAFDAQGNVVASATLPLGTTVAPLEVQSTSYNIASVLVQFTGTVGAVVDDLVYVVADQTNVPPVTQCQLTGPMGANGWYTGTVEATLTAEDEDGTVALTKWRLDGGEWQQYTGPVLISGDGPHTLEYYSVDNEGAEEEIQTDTLQIDATKPVVQLQLSHQFLWPPNGRMVPVTVSGSAGDALSGAHNVNFEVKDEYGEVQPSLTGFGQTVLLKASRRARDMDGRCYTVIVTCTDGAGNLCKAEQKVVVAHDRRQWWRFVCGAAKAKQEAKKTNLKANRRRWK